MGTENPRVGGSIPPLGTIYTGVPQNGGIKGPIMNDQLVLKGCRGVQIRVTHTRVNCLLGLMHLICF